MAEPVVLREEDVGRIGEYVKPWLREVVDRMVPRTEAAGPDTALLERMVRVEEEIRAQRELMDERFGSMEQRFEAVDRRFEELIRHTDKRFDAVDKRFEASDKRFEDLIAHTDKRFETVDKRFQHAHVDDRRRLRGRHVADDGVRPARVALRRAARRRDTLVTRRCSSSATRRGSGASPRSRRRGAPRRPSPRVRDRRAAPRTGGRLRTPPRRCGR